MTGRIIYATPEVPQPVGGVRVLCRHVEMLVEAGYDAAVWCPTPGHRFGFFDYDGPMLSGMEIDVTADDVLVPQRLGQPVCACPEVECRGDAPETAARGVLADAAAAGGLTGFRA